MPRSEEAREAAALWLARSRDAAFSDWMDLTLWLEADPANNEAYEVALRADDAAAAARIQSPPRVAINENVEPARSVSKRRYWIGGAAIAATTAAIAIAIPIWGPANSEFALETHAGEQRTMQLADGSRLDLNGSTRVILDRANPRTARVELGEATFSVVHDTMSPFTVTAGDTIMKDLGTTFNVVRTRDMTTVAVAEGSVLYDPAGAAVTITAGHMLRSADASPLLEVGQVEPGYIGSWRSGRLLYRDAPFARVAEDLGRAIGQPVTVAPEVATRTFSGGITTRGVEQQRLANQLSVLLDVSVSQGPNGWHLAPRHRASD